ncbi:DUF2752 domain-containing protein [Demequina sediminicola]|uniref:DUF2752 domain-containing protein n=1 Tax=Demequina sediminicola TaxID=1095026 RepID=UPI00191C3F0D|nr:DUF2752 domain-containing protein [Demequina sediminicola]
MVFPLVVGAGAAAAAWYVSDVDPNEPGHYPTCPSLWLTGLYCPGCGSLRAIHHLGNGELAAAWAMNPLAVIVIPWLVWRWVRWIWQATGHRVSRRLAPAWAIYALFGAVCLYAVLRNIPMFEPYLAP